MITDPQFGNSDDLFIDHYSLVIERSATDHNGNVHQYTYDTAGREISDTVTTLGAGVDGSVRRIDTAYNSQGLPYLLTSYADTGGTTIVNQVENIYNPGAAAHTRHIGGTGFRGDEGGLPLYRCTASLNGGQLTAQYTEAYN